MSVIIRGSVRRRLLAMLLGGVLLIWGGSAAFTAWETRHEMQELLDAHLAQSASLLIAQVGHDLEEIEQEHAESLHKYARNVVIQIWSGDGALLLHSADAPNTRLSTEEGFSDARFLGRAWRVYSVWDAEREYQVQVGEAVDVRNHLSGQIIEKLVFPLLLALPLLGLLIWYSVGISLKSIGHIGASLARRDPQYLEPVAGEVPAEIAPMVQRLNELLGRIRHSLESERRFTSDAAHELRTPLAALKAQLQVAKGASSEAERQHAMDQANLACGRAAALVDQLLTLARLDHEGWAPQSGKVDLQGVASEVLAEIYPHAAHRQVRLSLSGVAEASITGHAGLLAILIRNLVENAVRHSPKNGEVEVAIREIRDGAVLEVTDQGPGIPAGEREKVLQRFYRLAEDSSGSGLGLSIAARIAELHHAKLELGDVTDEKGLKVSVLFEHGAQFGLNNVSPSNSSTLKALPKR